MRTLTVQITAKVELTIARTVELARGTEGELVSAFAAIEPELEEAFGSVADMLSKSGDLSAFWDDNAFFEVVADEDEVGEVTDERSLTGRSYAKSGRFVLPNPAPLP
jgi:hypothetical protein